MSRKPAATDRVVHCAVDTASIVNHDGASLWFTVCSCGYETQPCDNVADLAAAWDRHESEANR